MTDEEVYINWRNNNSNIDRHNVTDTSIGHKHIHWNSDADRRKAFLDGYEQGQKDKLTDKEKLIGTFINVDLEKENEELKEQTKDLSESLDIMNNRESELLEQIEKMKCCGNCRKIFICKKSDKSGLKSKWCNEWELAE